MPGLTLACLPGSAGGGGMPRRGRRHSSSAVTIKDVAAQAGFSPATVTRALRGDSFVRSETKERIETVARELGYRPNVLARALVTRTTHTIGALIPSVGDAFWSGITSGIEARATAADYSVLIASSHDDRRRESQLIETFLAKRVDGVIIGSAATPPTAAGRSLLEVPAIYVDSDFPFPQSYVAAAVAAPPKEIAASIDVSGEDGVTRVAFDDQAPMRALVDHLLRAGRRRIAFVGVAPVRSALLRVLALRRALAVQRLAPVAIVEADRTMESGREATARLLAGGAGLDAIVAYDDVVAIGVMRAVRSLGLRIPDDVAVTGFDDIEVAAYLEPPLTTVRQPMAEMGELAANLLFERLRSREVDALHTLEGSLVIRQSSQLGGMSKQGEVGRADPT
jgi:DNA-binding LacI/PurR family transcriptional regulator